MHFFLYPLNYPCCFKSHLDVKFIFFEVQLWTICKILVLIQLISLNVFYIRKRTARNPRSLISVSHYLQLYGLMIHHKKGLIFFYKVLSTHLRQFLSSQSIVLLSWYEFRRQIVTNRSPKEVRRYAINWMLKELLKIGQEPPRRQRGALKP